MKKNSERITVENALDRLRDICSKTEKSPWEIRQKLINWGLESRAANLIAQLKKENFINTNRFAAAFARDKTRFNKWGKIKIRYQLKGHQIEDSIIDEALNQVDTPFYQDMISQELNKKFGSLKTGSSYQKKARIHAFASQRGYEPEFIQEFFRLKGL